MEDIWKHILKHLWVTEALIKPQKHPNMVLYGFLNHIVSILYERGPSTIPCSKLFKYIFNLKVYNKIFEITYKQGQRIRCSSSSSLRGLIEHLLKVHLFIDVAIGTWGLNKK